MKDHKSCISMLQDLRMFSSPAGTSFSRFLQIEKSYHENDKTRV